MDHRLVPPHRRDQRLTVTNVCVDEPVISPVVQAGQVGQIPRVGQSVVHRDLVAIGQRTVDEIRPDKPGAAGYQESQVRPVPRHRITGP